MLINNTWIVTHLKNKNKLNKINLLDGMFLAKMHIIKHMIEDAKNWYLINKDIKNKHKILILISNLLNNHSIYSFLIYKNNRKKEINLVEEDPLIKMIKLHILMIEIESLIKNWIDLMENILPKLKLLWKWIIIQNDISHAFIDIL
jgi:hypothetical protein